MNITNYTLPVELVCDHKMCLKCIMADYPQETNEVTCYKCDSLQKIKHEYAV